MLYRKKPVVIEARRVPTYDVSAVTEYLNESIDIAEWCGGMSHMMLADDEGSPDEALMTITGPHIAIKTMEGTMAALPGDYIICGVHGEFYPCNPDIFDATYEPVAA